VAEATQEEREAFLWMQGRMVELLLRHDLPRFRATFGSRNAEQTMLEHPYLQRPRQLAVLFYLRDELFESILPRIKRRLSFAAPRDLRTEGLPPRGRIDWQRTAAATMRDRPGEPPLEVRTRQRRRHFATPENLLTVTTIIEYRAAAQRLLDAEAKVSTQAIRHPLHAIVDACTRELAFLQFAGLVRESEQIAAGLATHTSTDLEQVVAEQSLPGRNSAYDDLLLWRRLLKQLRLLDRYSIETQPMLGSDPARDNYLYQVWLFYELADLLQREKRIIAWSRQPLTLTYTWGDDDATETYILRHDQAVSHGWVDAPGVRPDLFIVRSAAQEVREGNEVIWREGGYVLDAKYYKPRGNAKAPGDPLKRMIADLQLLDARNGALLFAFQNSASTLADGLRTEDMDYDLATAPPQPTALYHIKPQASTAQASPPETTIAIWRTQPQVADGGRLLRQTLETIFEQVHQALKDPPPVRCHGVFLDTLSADAHGGLASVVGLRWRDGSVLDAPLDDLLLCPKPHVGPWRVDIVSHSRDCCQNAPLCHIKHQPGARKPQRLTALEDIAQAIRVSETDESDDKTIAAVATQQVLAITKRYAQLLQPDIGHYKQWVNDELEVGDLWAQTVLLTEAQRETMALARFLWEQIEHIRASNFAGPTLLFTGVLEELTRVTIYRQSGKLHGANGQPLHDTLGTLGNCKQYGGTNWTILERVVVQGGFWQEQVAEQQALAFSSWIDMVKSIAYIRNDAAHKANVDRRAFQRLTQLYFGSSLSGIGVFNGLLLAWRVAQV
jgi:hypothetical protein